MCVALKPFVSLTNLWPFFQIMSLFFKLSRSIGDKKGQKSVD